MPRLDFPETRRGWEIPTPEPARPSGFTALAAIIAALAIGVAFWFFGHPQERTANAPAGPAGHDYNAGTGMTGVGDYGSRP
jgi:hypothetical protein